MTNIWIKPFFNWVSLHYKTWSYKKKEEEKDKHDIGKLIKKSPNKKMSFNSRFNAIQIVSQWKAFCRQRAPESNCARKKNLDTDIPVTFWNGARKIMQPIRIMSEPATRLRKWNQFR